MIHCNRWIKVDEAASELKIVHGLEFSWLGSISTEKYSQRELFKNFSEAFEHYEDEGDSLQKWIITMDESWACHFKVKSKLFIVFLYISESVSYLMCAFWTYRHNLARFVSRLWIPFNVDKEGMMLNICCECIRIKRCSIHVQLLVQSIQNSSNIQINFSFYYFAHVHKHMIIF